MSSQPSPRSFLQHAIGSPDWFDALVEETTTLDNLGVHAAMMSVRLHTTTEPARVAAQARTLFGLILRPTDRLEQTAPLSFSVLLAPQRDLAETVRQVGSIAESFDTAGIHASTGFAQRRPAESLLDTWARAEAQLDRAAYRSEHQGGIKVA